LLSDSLRWEINSIDQQNNLFVKKSREDLPLNLDRGEGLNVPALKATRKTLPIRAAKAGANGNQAQRSFDDNELSDWVNDGDIANAWIEYTLEKTSEIDELDIKLNNFRSRSYPIQVFVDEKLVFDGNTKTTLGYDCIPLSRAKGKRIKIQLKGSSQQKDSSKHAEIGGKKLDDG